MFFFRKILLLSYFVLNLCACKKDDELSEYLTQATSYKSEEVDLAVEKTTVFKEDGFQYAYADFIEIEPSKILLASTRFFKVGDLEEFSEIVISRSLDNGESWGAPIVVVANFARLNISMPNLLQLSETHVILSFSAKESQEEINLMMVESFDSGETWSEPRVIVKNDGYNITNNGVIRKIDGVLYIPVAQVYGNIYKNYGSQRVLYYYSEDEGRTWKKSGYLAAASQPLMEPFINGLANGDHLINLRTKSGTMYFVRKKLGNNRWELYDSGIPSSESPQCIHRLFNSPSLIMAWNRVNKTNSSNKAIRNPLSLGVSNDDGYHWTHVFDIEKDSIYDYSYAAIRSNESTVFLAYYQMDKVKFKGQSKIIFCRIAKKQLNIE